MVLSFFIGFALSFIGSLPFGMINMAVAHEAIHKGIKAGIIMAFGAALIELVQVFIALKFTWLFEEGGALSNVIYAVAITVFFGAGIYFLFFAKAKAANLDEKYAGKKNHSFLKGIIISSLNLMAIPYWIFYGALLNSNDLLQKENESIIVFSAGVMLGVLALLIAYAFLGAKILSKSEVVTRWVNKFIGLVLIGFGIYQLVKWLNN